MDLIIKTNTKDLSEAFESEEKLAQFQRKVAGEIVQKLLDACAMKKLVNTGEVKKDEG